MSHSPAGMPSADAPAPQPEDPVSRADAGSSREPGKALVVSTESPPKPNVRVVKWTQGDKNRVPKEGWRAKAYTKGWQFGATYEEIIREEQKRATQFREALREFRGTLMVGVFSDKGGDGKSTISNQLWQRLYKLNPGKEHIILIDVNTSKTTQHRLNGLRREDFLPSDKHPQGRFWTMFTLHDFIVEKRAHGEEIEYEDIFGKLAFRDDPQIPFIPMRLHPQREKGANKGRLEREFTDAMYDTVISELKRFCTMIIHDFGTEKSKPLTQRALQCQHMLVAVTHAGEATVEMVGETVDYISWAYPDLLHNTIVVHNQLDPSDDGLTREEAVNTVNHVLTLLGWEESRLALDEMLPIGYDAHLKREAVQYWDQVDMRVQAQLWTLVAKLLELRVEFEKDYVEMFHERFPEAPAFTRREHMGILRLDQLATPDPDDPDATPVEEINWREVMPTSFRGEPPRQVEPEPAVS